ncbi:MAG: hypothetical protein M1826_003852 [Phylliscum demangeonii]|nr:MAG: hypothetical protein M1826_003852 [Phylliscum demangeonii]
MPPTEFLAFLPAPGDIVRTYDAGASPSEQGAQIPRAFRDAMTVRTTVFVEEQCIPAAHERDDDDARSFHWVAYASVFGSGVKDSSGSRKASETKKMPAATVRLVPPPHPPHPGSPSADRSTSTPAQQGPPPPRSRWHDGVEPYVKLGRLATVPAYRGLGLARFVAGSALEWAGLHPFALVPLPSPTSTEAAKARGFLGPRPEWKGLVLVHAQKRVQEMWRKLGFEVDDQLGEWLEEGIVHVGMWKRIAVAE